MVVQSQGSDRQLFGGTRQNPENGVGGLMAIDGTPAALTT
jgi:hypothetical protein